MASFRCTRAGFFSPWICDDRLGSVMDASTTAAWFKSGGGTLGNLSFATAEGGCTLLSYPSSSGTRKVANFVDTIDRHCAWPTLCPVGLQVTTSSAPTVDFVIGKGAGTTLLGVGTSGGGAQLFQTTNCGTWTSVGSPVPGATEFKPALVGTKPGFFYLDPTRTLRVYVP